MVEEKAGVKILAPENIETIEWEGIKCQVKKIGQAELITAADGTSPEYQTAVQKVFDRAVEASDQLQALELFNPEIPLPKFILRVAVLPRKDFEKILFKGMPNPQNWAWAHSCSRTLRTFADTFVHDGIK